jgi:hypothetical protein
MAPGSPKPKGWQACFLGFPEERYQSTLLCDECHASLLEWWGELKVVLDRAKSERKTNAKQIAGAG